MKVWPRMMLPYNFPRCIEQRSHVISRFLDLVGRIVLLTWGDLLSRPMPVDDDPILLSEEDQLIASDLFGLGCTIAELYRTEPLFNIQTLQPYHEGKFSPSLSMV